MTRLDQEICNRNLASSRAQAARAVKDGFVKVDGEVVKKPAYKIDISSKIEINDPSMNWVSRGALKLLAIIDDVEGKTALDLGASTGGFTQVLLEHGAKHVFAVDVGHGQLHHSLADDERITMREGLNVKALDADTFSSNDWPYFDVMTCDLSFISLVKALPPALDLAKNGCEIYALVKPQFELSPQEIDKGGIVKSSEARNQALANIQMFFENSGWKIAKTMQSPIEGGDGNIEYLIKAVKV